jgi:hypothetical protein
MIKNERISRNLGCRLVVEVSKYAVNRFGRVARRGEDAERRDAHSHGDSGNECAASSLTRVQVGNLLHDGGILTIENA